MEYFRFRIGVHVHTCVCEYVCAMCGLHACGGQRLIMSFFLYHVSVFISGDWVSQRFQDWSRQTGHTRSTAPPILGIRPWSARFSCECWGIWTRVLIFAQRVLLPSEPFLQPHIENSLFDSLCFFYFYYCPQTILWFLSISFRVEKSFSWEEKNKCILEVWC